MKGKRRTMTSLHAYLDLGEGPPTPEQHEHYVYFLSAAGFFRDAERLALTLAAWFRTDGAYGPMLAMRLQAQAHVLDGAARWKSRR